jgi:hypothetical protein
MLRRIRLTRKWPAGITAPHKGTRMRATVLLVLLCALALGVSVVQAELYEDELTPEERSGPEQPVSFSHAKHAGELQIECLYCHGAAEKSQAAGIPAVSVCMGCHQWVKHRQTDDELAKQASAAEIAKIQKYYDGGQAIPWVKIHNLPEHAQFKHYKHVQAGFDCQTCHGAVETMKRVYLVPDTQYTSRSFYLPSAKLEMGWCMECHLQRGGPDDCSACHY